MTTVVQSCDPTHFPYYQSGIAYYIKYGKIVSLIFQSMSFSDQEDSSIAKPHNISYTDLGAPLAKNGACWTTCSTYEGNITGEIIVVNTTSAERYVALRTISTKQIWGSLTYICE